jgi:hypothetical protein
MKWKKMSLLLSNLMMQLSIVTKYIVLKLKSTLKLAKLDSGLDKRPTVMVVDKKQNYFWQK